MLSMDWKLGWKERAMPHPQQHHPVPQGHPFSTKCWLATGSPPEAQKQSHKNHTAFTGPKCTLQTFHHSAHTRAHLTSCVGGTTPPTSTSHLCSLSSCNTFHTIPVVCSALTAMVSPFTPCHAHGSTWRGSKVTPDRCHAYLPPTTLSGSTTQTKHILTWKSHPINVLLWFSLYW